MFHFSLWFKLSVFFSLVLFSVGIQKRRGKKPTGKILNVESTFCDVTLCKLIAGGTGPINKKNNQPFYQSPFIKTAPKMKIFIHSTYPFFTRNPLLACPPAYLLINHIFSWKSKLKPTGVDITCLVSRCKILKM